MAFYYFVWQPSSSSLLKHTQSVTPGLRMEQSITCLDNYHVHFNLKGRAPGTYEPSDNSAVVCIDVGVCVFWQAMSNTTVYFLRNVSPWWQKVGRRPGACADGHFMWFCRISARRVASLEQNTEITFWRNRRYWGVQVLPIHLSHPHPLTRCLKITTWSGACKCWCDYNPEHHCLQGPSGNGMCVPGRLMLFQILSDRSQWQLLYTLSKAAGSCLLGSVPTAQSSNPWGVQISFKTPKASSACW